MAVTNITDACVAGAMAGLMSGRFVGSITATDYTAEVNAAAAIKDEFLTENTASGAAIADADGNANAPLAVFAAALAATLNTGATSTTATDYLAMAKQIYGSAKQAISKF